MSVDDRRPSRGASIRPADLTKDRGRALALTPVSRETLERLDRLVGLLLEWQQRINLIAPSTEPKIWTRHVAELVAAPAAGAAGPHLGRSRQRRRVPGSGRCLRAGGNARRACAPGREHRQKSGLFAGSGEPRRRAGNGTRRAGRRFRQSAARADRGCDRAGPGATAEASHSGKSTVEKRVGWPVSQGTRCGG